MRLLERDSNKELTRECKEFGTSTTQPKVLATATKDFPNASPPCVAQYIAFAADDVHMLHCGTDTIFKQGRNILLVSSVHFERRDGQQTKRLDSK